MSAATSLLSAIGSFRDEHKDDPKFSSVIESLNSSEEQIEKLVPSADDTSPDAADPGRTPPEKQPKTLEAAGRSAMNRFQKK